MLETLIIMLLEIIQHILELGHRVMIRGLIDNLHTLCLMSKIK